MFQTSVPINPAVPIHPVLRYMKNATGVVSSIKKVDVCCYYIKREGRIAILCKC